MVRRESWRKDNMPDAKGREEFSLFLARLRERNLAARALSSPQCRQQIVRSKKGKGSYRRAPVTTHEH